MLTGETLEERAIIPIVVRGRAGVALSFVLVFFEPNRTPTGEGPSSRCGGGVASHDDRERGFVQPSFAKRRFELSVVCNVSDIRARNSHLQISPNAPFETRNQDGLGEIGAAASPIICAFAKSHEGPTLFFYCPANGFAP